MEYRILGSTDVKVSKICLGTMTWGYQNSEQEAHEQLNYAVEKGINFIDTAEVYAIPPTQETYGKTETYIGNWLAQRDDREKLIIASKIAGIGVPYVRNGEGVVPSAIKTAVDNSLRRLQTDYIDLYQIHWPQRPVPLWGKMNFDDQSFAAELEEQYFIGVLEALDEVIKEGKVRYVGLSNETAWGTMKWLQLAEKHNLPRMVSVQNAYSLVRREYEVALSEVSVREKAGLLAYSPLAGGILTGKYRNNQLPAGSRFATWGSERMGAYLRGRVSEAVESFAVLAKKYDITQTELALAFVNDRPFVTSNIIGATSLPQLEECINSAHIKLSEELLQEIDVLFSENPNPATH